MTISDPLYLMGLTILIASRSLGAQIPGPGRFVPLVELPDSGAHCDTIHGGPLQPGETGFLLRFGGADSLQRVVSATWDSTGKLVRYSDARGDLRGLPVAVADRGPRTTIIIDVPKGMALLLNENHGSTRGSSMATVGAALVAKNLGPPQQLLDRLHRQCGAPGPR